VHFGGFTNHIGFYPGSSPIIKFKDELSKYKTVKGSIQFPIGKLLPVGLIRKIVKHRNEKKRISKKGIRIRKNSVKHGAGVDRVRDADDKPGLVE